jgi:tetratricopeptide (TPR) repeat protein
MTGSYDAFLSYSEHDHAWVETHLLPRLDSAGITYLDYQKFQLGAPKLNEIERAVINSRKTLMVIGPQYLVENWQGFEFILTSSYGLDRGEWPAIPLIIEICELPPRLKALVSLDLRAPTETDWSRLTRELKLETQTPTSTQTQTPRPKIFHGVSALPPHFVGRDELMQDMIARLTSGQNVSLSADGQGGIGKTTLAVALARHPDVWAHFPDGVLWAGLGKNANGMSALAAWGEALGQDLSSLTSIEDRRAKIEQLIGARRMLLIIDDAWELEAAEMMKCGSENCSYLLTTRHKGLANRFAGREQVEAVPMLAEEAAWTLLQTLAPEAYNAYPTAARALANSVGGLPLAVELLGGYLAAQEGALFPDLFPNLNRDALAELSDPRRRLHLATQRLGSKAGKVTLQETLTLSLDDLSEEVQNAFYALGAFAPKPATFSREAAESVAETDGKNLALFAARNLLEIVGTRFAFHQTLADLARTKMPLEAQTRHREFYLDLANQDPNAWKSIEPEYSQIIWGFQQNPEDESLLDWVWSMGPFQRVRGLWLDRLRWYLRGLEIFGENEEAKTKATLLHEIGYTLDDLGRRKDALNYYYQALSIQDKLLDKANKRASLVGIGRVYANTGQWVKAIQYYEQALPIYEEADDQKGLATVLNNIGGVYSNIGEQAKALEYYEQALSIYEEKGDQEGLALTLNNIGMNYHYLDKPAEALEYCKQALLIREEIGDLSGKATSLNSIGLVYAILGERVKAMDYLEQALLIKEKVGDQNGASVTRYNMARIFDEEGRLPEAITQMRKVVILSEQIQSPHLERFQTELAQLEAELAAQNTI